MSFQLAASAEMLFLDLPFVERVKRIHELGFQVEIWNWANKDLEALEASGATFSSMTGYLEGSLISDEGADELVRTAKLSLEAAKIIDSPRLNLHGTGLDGNGQAIIQGTNVSDADWEKAVDTLSRIAELGNSIVAFSRSKTLILLLITLEHLLLRRQTPWSWCAESVVHS